MDGAGHDQPAGGGDHRVVLSVMEPPHHLARAGVDGVDVAGGGSAIVAKIGDVEEAADDGGRAERAVL